MPLDGHNPFVNPPRLPSPSKSRFHNRSLSRSPVRQHPRDFDPLLRDLSPTSTLRAFVTAPTDTSKSDALTASIHTSSASERALGAKAAQACLDLRTWTLEMESWQWPGTFDFPEPARKKLRMSALSSGQQTAIDGEEEYWGCLPAKTVREYERRADEIGQCLDDIDVEELKDYVLNSHYRVDSRPTSRGDKRTSMSSISSARMRRLDDYTALVTATILQALPFLTRLGRLLDIWTIRLIVLHNAPKYIQDLLRAQTSLEGAWTAIAAASGSEAISQFDRKTMLDMKGMIEQQVGSLGRRLDRFLDDLEGRDDTVPDSWIDEFEVLETAYGSWVVQAERRVLQFEWRHRQSYVEPNSIGQALDYGGVSEIEDPALDDDAVMRLSMDKSINSFPQQPPSADARHLNLSIPSVVEPKPDGMTDSARTETPLSGKEEGAAQVAKRRAAFLHDIEVNNSLKQSKSPVRPFEHASSAFTKLFKKNQSPEQARPKRSVSNDVKQPGSAGEVTRGSKWLGLGRQNSVQSAKDSSKSSRAVSPDVDTATTTRQAFPPNNSQRAVSEPAQVPSHYGPPFNPGAVSPGAIDVSEKPAPETYKPTGLDSPFSSPDKEEFFSSPDKKDFPENWPLNQNHVVDVGDDPADDRVREQEVEITPDDSDSGPEIYKPAMPMQTDAFDALFVQNMPQISRDEHDSIKAPEAIPAWEDTARRSLSLSRRGDATYLDMVPARSRPTSSARMSTSASIQHHPRTSIDPSSERTSNSTSESTGPNQVRSSSSSRLTPPFIRPGIQRSTSSPPTSPESSNIDNVGEASMANTAYIARPYSLKRASTTSIGVYSRSEVKSVDVQRPSRTNSASSRATPPHTPGLSIDHDPMSKTRSTSYRSAGASSNPPTRRTSLSSQATSPLGRDAPFTVRSANEASLLAGEASGSPGNEVTLAPLNVAMAKRRVKNHLSKENERPQSPIGSGVTDARDTFDRHVSEVLERLPAPIRFKPRPGAETPVSRAGEPRGYIAPRAKTPNMRVPSRPTNMTIAPAETSPKKSSSASDPEVKLYHLTQTGREEPIKLFVRLVGEGERVMVRVGGGWADLADYLRQYADHHGSRTVSDGALEVQAFTAPLSRKVSGPAEARAKTPGPGTPKVGTPLRPDSSESDKDFFARASTPNRERPFTSNGRQTPTSLHNSTPKSTSTGSSRPSTANASRPPSRQGGTAEVGLAGPPSGKKGNLPEHKAKWVEGMLERAKKASAEKSTEGNQKYFSELGKAGGTRRVIFRSSPGVSTGEKGK